MKSYFDTEFFAGNRRRLRELFTGTAPIVLTAHAQLQRNSDMAYPFRQDSNFWYLTGITEPNIVLVMDKDKEYLILSEDNDIRDLFEGSVSITGLTERSGIRTVLDAKTGWKQLSSRLSRVKHVATLAAPAAYIQQLDFYSNPARAALAAKLQEASEGIELLDLREHFLRMRMVKQPAELAAIRASVDLTVTTFKDLEKKLSRMSSENEVEAFITSQFRKNGATHGYDPIVAGGLNACTLHYGRNNAPLSKNHLLLIDVGAEVEYYSADITRTLATSDKVTKRQRVIHEAVDEVLQFGLSQLKPGITFKDAEQKLRDFMGEKLRELNLIKTIDKDSIHRYYPHAPHFLGLDVHDTGDYERPLEPNMVLTVEPGIYVPEEEIGIRLEEDILITEDGIEVLSQKLPTSLSLLK